MDEEALLHYMQRCRLWKLVLRGTLTDDGRVRMPRTIGRREWQGNKRRRAPPVAGTAVPAGLHQAGTEEMEEIPTVVVTRSAQDPTDVIGPDNAQDEDMEPMTQPSVTELEYGSLERRPTTSSELHGSGGTRAIEIRRSDPPGMTEGDYGSLRRQPTGRRLRRRQPSVTTGSIGRLSESREGEIMDKDDRAALERQPTLGRRLRRFLGV